MHLLRNGSVKFIVAGAVRQGQKKPDRRNEKYYPGAFAIEWLAQNYGTASCNVASTSDGGVGSIETERGIVGAGETTAGSPQDGWADAGGANESDGSERDNKILNKAIQEISAKRRAAAMAKDYGAVRMG